MISRKKHCISIENVINLSIVKIVKNNYKGYDPYDALNSKFINFICINNKYLKAGFTQFFRRFPINLRKLFIIHKGHNPKGIGLLLESFSKLYSLDRSNTLYLNEINKLLDILEKTKSLNYSGSCWGYNFPWQSRVVYKPKWTPTIVNTSFIGHALLYCYEITNNKKALELVESIPEFITKNLNILNENDTICFSYSPIDKEYVHNANMLGASFLARFSKIFNRPDLLEIAHKSLKYSINHQNEDGSWYFANVATHKWIDSFHTGFKLESIRWFIELGEGFDYIDNYEKGVEFYFNNFFLEDGTPKYYHNKIYPIDIHAPAEAIYFFSKLNNEKYIKLTNNIYNWVLSNMYSTSNHYFYFRISKFTKNKIEYARWSSSWMMRGLSELKYNLHHHSNGKV